MLSKWFNELKLNILSNVITDMYINGNINSTDHHSHWNKNIRPCVFHDNIKINLW
jgi:hypothetical protein